MTYKKIFHGQWDGTAGELEELDTCTECGTENVRVVQFTAEENSGEIYTVEVCKACLTRYAAMLE